MKEVIFVYDDTIIPGERVKTIVGTKSFGEIILKRRSMLHRVEDVVKKYTSNTSMLCARTPEQLLNLDRLAEDSTVIYWPSNSIMLSDDNFGIILQKAPFVENVTTLESSGKKYGVIFPSYEQYAKFIQGPAKRRLSSIENKDSIALDIFLDLSDYDSLLSFISGGFDARYFNSISGDANTVTKRSNDKNKMKMEYTYFSLLPERMRRFMVMPYDYTEDDVSASYSMERMPMTDLAIRWTHGAVDMAELRKVLDRTFYFFESREQKPVTKSQYIKTADALYIDKVIKRIKNLKSLDAAQGVLDNLVAGTRFNSIDEIISWYLELYDKHKKRFLSKKRDFTSVVGHGDVFFANMLYSKEADLLRLIDPKGALTEDDLWTDPYYDVAKLSHSICGNYDFFNMGAYDILVDESLHLNLKVHTNNTAAVSIFKEYLEQYGFDYDMVRLYEASLFLSMLPLHIDVPRKVLGFILNAIAILEELENE